MRRWKQANREKWRAGKRRYYERNRERLLPAMREYTKARYAEDPQKANDASRQWREKNPDANRAKAARYRARLLGARLGGEPTVALLRERDGDTCGICGEDLDFTEFRAVHIDHVVPLSRGGDHSLENTQLAHASCNVRKRDKLAV